MPWIAMRSVIVLLDMFAIASMRCRSSLHHAMAPAAGNIQDTPRCTDGRFALRPIVTRLSCTRCVAQNTSRRGFFDDPRGSTRTPCG
jgi:hypothetical protein